jgi:hypothetical protein
MHALKSMIAPRTPDMVNSRAMVNTANPTCGLRDDLAMTGPVMIRNFYTNSM